MPSRIDMIAAILLEAFDPTEAETAFCRKSHAWLIAHRDTKPAKRRKGRRRKRA